MRMCYCPARSASHLPEFATTHEASIRTFAGSIALSLISPEPACVEKPRRPVFAPQRSLPRARIASSLRLSAWRAPSALADATGLPFETEATNNAASAPHNPEINRRFEPWTSGSSQRTDERSGANPMTLIERHQSRVEATAASLAWQIRPARVKRIQMKSSLAQVSPSIKAHDRDCAAARSGAHRHLRCRQSVLVAAEPTE